ncbi:hypothetical protein [Methanobacterium oryzae]|uniref:hypothetical protein n=1 Tax=Methanobacterium oryzae TaxID=69540 RepID=UPI003D1EC04D
MEKLKTTMGLVGKDGIILKDHSTFNEGEVVVIISAENFNELLEDMMKIKENIESSKVWIDEIKDIDPKNFKK